MDLESRLDYGKWPKAPVRILEAIVDYADNRNPHGHFVTAVLENNLTEAVFRADDESLAGLKDIVFFVHWEIPHACHGSPENVTAWLKKEKSSHVTSILVEAATNARNVLRQNLDLFEGEESTDERESYDEAASVADSLHDALQLFEKEAL